MIADSVKYSYEVYLRARAYSTTIALVMVHDPGWFSFDDAEFANDAVLSFVHNNQAVPVIFFDTAWAKSTAYFVKGICTNDRSLKDLVRSVNGWHHCWLSRTTPSGPITATNTSAAISSGSNALTSDLQNQLEHCKDLAWKLQSQKECAEAEVHDAGRRRQRNMSILRDGGLRWAGRWW